MKSLFTYCCFIVIVFCGYSQQDSPTRPHEGGSIYHGRRVNFTEFTRTFWCLSSYRPLTGQEVIPRYVRKLGSRLSNEATSAPEDFSATNLISRTTYR